MDTVRAKQTDDYGSDGSEEESGIFEGHRHGQNSRSQWTLQEMRQRSKSAEIQSKAINPIQAILSAALSLEHSRVWLIHLSVHKWVVDVSIILQLPFLSQHCPGIS